MLAVFLIVMELTVCLFVTAGVHAAIRAAGHAAAAIAARAAAPLAAAGAHRQLLPCTVAVTVIIGPPDHAHSVLATLCSHQRQLVKNSSYPCKWHSY